MMLPNSSMAEASLRPSSSLRLILLSHSPHALVPLFLRNVRRSEACVSGSHPRSHLAPYRASSVGRLPPPTPTSPHLRIRGLMADTVCQQPSHHKSPALAQASHPVARETRQACAFGSPYLYPSPCPAAGCATSLMTLGTGSAPVSMSLEVYKRPSAGLKGVNAPALTLESANLRPHH